eukprot:4723472-Prorocentrum_lima.AAC.1
MDDEAKMMRSCSLLLCNQQEPEQSRVVLSPSRTCSFSRSLTPVQPGRTDQHSFTHQYGTETTHDT